MNSRHLFLQMLAAVAVLASANVLVHWMSANSVPRQLLRRAEHGDGVTELFLGNSTMAAGLDEGTFAASAPGSRPLNLGLGGTDPVEHYLIFLEQHKHRPAAVYYGFLDTQLTDPPAGDWSKLVGNRALIYYTDLNTAIDFYSHDDPLQAAAMRATAAVPLLVERAALWARVERLRRGLGEWGLPQKATNRFGQAEDFALLEPNDPAQFAATCGGAAAERLPLSGPVTALFRKIKEQHTRLYAVEMPMTEQHRRRFYSSPEWRAYREHVAALVREAGGVLVPAAAWVSDDGFADHLHLNAVGAEVFSRRLARWGEASDAAD